MTRGGGMHTAVVLFGVIVDIVLVLAILSIIVGVVWIISPLKDKMYMGTVYTYRYYTPLGGRETGLFILGLGVTGLILGFLLDKEHVRLTKRFGSRT
jgi:hypothetical protein